MRDEDRNLEWGNQLSGIIPNSPQMWPKMRTWELHKEILTWECNEALIICYLAGPFPLVLHHDPVRGLQFKDNWVLCKQIPEGTRKIGIIYQYEWSGKIVRFLLIKVYYVWVYYGQSHLHTPAISQSVIETELQYTNINSSGKWCSCSMFHVCLPAWGMLTTRMQETVLK